MRTPTPRRWGVALVALAAGCTDAWAQPRRGARPHPPAVRHRDGGVPGEVVERPPTHGTIDPVAVQQVIRGQTGAIRSCYQSGIARDATLHGRIELRLRVEPDGSVSETSSGGDDGLRAVGRCIEHLFEPVRFPRPTGGAATVTAPFDFAAEG